MKSKLYLLLTAFLTIPLVRAEECGITNLASCIPEKFFNFLVNLLNAPLQPLLNLIYILLTEPVNISIFSELWSIIIYMLSLFYGLLLLVVGFRFLVSGHSPEQREKAKSHLMNILIMIIFVQMSYFLYSLVLEMMSSMTIVIFDLIPNDFFLLTVDNLANVGLEITFLIPYLLTITTTLIILTIRYACVSAGVIFFAIGIFFYFIEYLNQYGKLILNGLFTLITLPFFYSIIFQTSSKLLDIPIFENFKILVMIGAFSLVILSTLFLLLFVIIKSATMISSVTKLTSLVSK